MKSLFRLIVMWYDIGMIYDASFVFRADETYLKVFSRKEFTNQMAIIKSSQDIQIVHIITTAVVQEVEQAMGQKRRRDA